MKYYTRKLLAEKYKMSLSGIRKFLKRHNILHKKIKYSWNNLPLFLYSLLDIIDLIKKLPSLYKCSVCGERFKPLNMQGTRCNECYIKRYCNRIIYGNETWLKIIQPDLINKALNYLNSFRPTAK